jgi:hypothetical protein
MARTGGSGASLSCAFRNEARRGADVKLMYSRHVRTDQRLGGPSQVPLAR